MRGIGGAVAAGVVLFAACTVGEKSSTKAASDPALPNSDPKVLAYTWLAALVAKDEVFLADRTALPFAQNWFGNGDIRAPLRMRRIDPGQVPPKWADQCPSAATNEVELRSLLGCIQRNAPLLRTIDSGFKQKVANISLDTPATELGRWGLTGGDVKTILAAPRDHLVSVMFPDRGDGYYYVVIVAIKGGKVTQAFLPGLPYGE